MCLVLVENRHKEISFLVINILNSSNPNDVESFIPEVLSIYYMSGTALHGIIFNLLFMQILWRRF